MYIQVNRIKRASRIICSGYSVLHAGAIIVATVANRSNRGPPTPRKWKSAVCGLFGYTSQTLSGTSDTSGNEGQVDIN